MKKLSPAPAKFSGDVPVHQQGFRSVASRRILRLRVQYDRHRFFDIRAPIRIDVAYTVGMAHHRNLCMIHDMLNELVGSSRNEKVDRLMTFQHIVDIIVGFRQHQTSLR